MGVASTTNSFSSPVIGPDGTIYVGGQSGRLAAITDNGSSASLKWAVDFPNDTGECCTHAVTSSSPAIVYIGTYTGHMYAVRDDGTKGTILWTFAKCPGSAQHTAAVGADGTLVCQFYLDMVAFEPGFIGEGAKIKGSVKTVDGYPAAGAYVGYSTSPRPLPDNWYSPVLTDADGNYEIRVLASGSYYVAAWTPGFAVTDDATVTLTDTSVQTINFTLTRCGANLARGGTAYTDHLRAEPQFAPANGNDGRLATRFASADGQFPVYYMVDLGSDVAVNQALIYWENSSGRTYKVQCLTSEWSPEFDWEAQGVTVYETTCGNTGIRLSTSAGVDPIKFASRTAQYWRVQVEKSNGGVMSLWELELNDQLRPPRPTTG